VPSATNDLLVLDVHIQLSLHLVEIADGHPIPPASQERERKREREKERERERECVCVCKR
jgi:hypothetical protein